MNVKTFFSKSAPVLLFLLILAIGFGNAMTKRPYVTGKSESSVVGGVANQSTFSDSDYMAGKVYASPSPTSMPKIDESVLFDENRPAKFRSDLAQKIKAALPSGVFLRDFIALPNNRGYLVLYVEKPQLGEFPGDDKNGDGIITIDEHEGSCPSDYYGQQLEGAYYLGLVRAGKLINAVPMPHSQYEPNKPVFRQLRSVQGSTWVDESVPSNDDIIEPSILKLEDLTGDGIKNELSLMVGYIACGHNDYAIGGYDQDSDKAIFFGIEPSDYAENIHGNFYPSTDGSVLFTSGCDHGAEQETRSYFLFDKKKKSYVEQFSRTAVCLYGEGLKDIENQPDETWTGEVIAVQWSSNYLIKNETPSSRNKYPYFVAEWRSTNKHPEYKQKIRITGKLIQDTLNCKDYGNSENKNCLPSILVNKAEQL